MAEWVRTAADGVELILRVVPRASRDGVAGAMGDALKIRLRAPPVEGKANQALIAFLADRLGVSKRAVAIVCGETGRAKRVRVAGISAAAAAARLRPEAE